jgi:hypothetical protein
MKKRHLLAVAGIAVMLTAMAWPASSKDPASPTPGWYTAIVTNDYDGTSKANKDQFKHCNCDPTVYSSGAGAVYLFYYPGPGKNGSYFINGGGGGSFFFSFDPTFANPKKSEGVSLPPPLSSSSKPMCGGMKPTFFEGALTLGGIAPPLPTKDIIGPQLKKTGIRGPIKTTFIDDNHFQMSGVFGSDQTHCVIFQNIDLLRINPQ